MPSIQVGDSHTFSKEITAQHVEAFAELIGDDNPIHLDPEYAATTRFGRRIAHGMLVAGLISAALAQGWPGAIYLGQTLDFRAPVYLEDTITAKATVTKVRSGKPIITFHTECRNQDDGTVLEGEAVCLVPE